jgi:hypothetical protein
VAARPNPRLRALRSACQGRRRLRPFGRPPVQPRPRVRVDSPLDELDRPQRPAVGRDVGRDPLRRFSDDTQVDPQELRHALKGCGDRPCAAVGSTRALGNLHLAGQPSRMANAGSWTCPQWGIQTAAESGADRRSAKIADAPINQIARSAPLGEAAPLPRGGMSQARHRSARRQRRLPSTAPCRRGGRRAPVGVLPVPGPATAGSAAPAAALPSPGARWRRLPPGRPTATVAAGVVGRCPGEPGGTGLRGRLRWSATLRT